MKNLRSKNLVGQAVEAQVQTDLVSKMEDMEANFKKGLEQLRSEYIQPNDDLGKSDFAQKFKEFEIKTKESIAQLKKEVLALHASTDNIKNELDKLKKQNNFKKLVFHGIPEKNQQNLFDDICDVATTYLNLDLTKNDISSCARIGKNRSTTNNQLQNQNKVRPVVVEFTTQWKRDDVFYAKKKFKNSGILVSEMLVKHQFDLFLKTREIYKNNAWTNRGDIFVAINNKKVCIKNVNDLQTPK